MHPRQVSSPLPTCAPDRSARSARSALPRTARPAKEQGRPATISSSCAISCAILDDEGFLREFGKVLDERGGGARDQAGTFFRRRQQRVGADSAVGKSRGIIQGVS